MSDQIIEAEPADHFTGLVDSNGKPIMRRRERVKFGFVVED
jgi:hypothetical protein